MRARNKTAIAGVAGILLLLAFDQFTKYLAYTFLTGTDGIPLIPGVFELYYLENSGAAFGIFRNHQILFIFIAVLILALVLYVYYKIPQKKNYLLLRWICILIGAGAAGNMIDRLINGYVIDFLYFILIDFPVFNIADCYVCVGTTLLLISLLTVYRNDDFSFLKLNRRGDRNV